MRVMGVMTYHCRRRWPLTLLFVLALAAVTMITLLVVMPRARQMVMDIDPQGYVQEQVSFDSLTLSQNPNAASDNASYTLLIMVLAVLTIRKNRQFLVSLSVTRYEILLGSLLFLIAASVTLALAGCWIIPMLTRVVALCMGMTLKGGVSPGMILTGGDPLFWANLGSSVCYLLFTGCLWVFVGYVMMRWWKPILILIAVGIVSLIFLARLVQWHAYVQDLAERVIEFVRWAAEWAIPAIQAFWEESNSLVWSLRYLLAGAVLTVLSYPIMRGMKVT